MFSNKYTVFLLFFNAYILLYSSRTTLLFCIRLSYIAQNIPHGVLGFWGNTEFNTSGNSHSKLGDEFRMYIQEANYEHTQDAERDEDNNRLIIIVERSAFVP